MLAEICISFSILSGSSAQHIPIQAQDLSKTRVSKQYEQVGQSKTQKISLNFDDKSCAYQGEYWFSADTLTLSSDHMHWQGRLELALTTLLDGAKIDFTTVLPNLAGTKGEAKVDRFEAAFFEQTTLRSEKKAPSKVWPWVAVGLAGAGAAYTGVKVYQHYNKKEAAPASEAPKKSGPKKVSALLLPMFFSF